VPVRWASGPLLRVPTEEARKSVLMRFPGNDSSILSGLMRGVAETRGRPAILDEPVGLSTLLGAAIVILGTVLVTGFSLGSLLPKSARS